MLGFLLPNIHLDESRDLFIEEQSKAISVIYDEINPTELVDEIKYLCVEWRT